MLEYQLFQIENQLVKAKNIINMNVKEVKKVFFLKNSISKPLVLNCGQYLKNSVDEVHDNRSYKLRSTVKAELATYKNRDQYSKEPALRVNDT